MTGDERQHLADMTSRWPEADYVEDRLATATFADRIFKPENWQPDQPLRIVFIGTDFEIRVWETLLASRSASASTYSDIAAHLGKPKAARAVGTAVGRNPVSFVVPCHRVLGKSGGLVRLSLGPDPQARHPRLGGRHRGPRRLITVACRKSPCHRGRPRAKARSPEYIRRRHNRACDRRLE